MKKRKEEMFVFLAYVIHRHMAALVHLHRLVSNSRWLLPFLPADSEKDTGNGQDSGAE